MPCIGILSSTLYALCIETKMNFVNQNKGKITRNNLPMGQSKFSYELTFWFILIENGGKQKSKNTLGVEINQFCDTRYHEKFLCHQQNVRG